MRISSTGNVGLGVTDPQYKLDMIGDINVSGEIRINGIPYINSVLVTPSYYSLFDRIAGPSTLTPNYTFTSSNSFSVYRAGILNISYSGDAKSVNIGLINATINIINTVTQVTIYTKVTSLLADQATKNYSLPSILDNIGLTYGTYHATITFNTNTQIDNNNFQTLKVLFFPDNNVSNGLYFIDDAAPFVVYKEQVPANRVVIKMQTNVGDVDLGPFSTNTGSIDDPLFGTANQTTPSRWKVQYLSGTEWIDLYTFNEFTTRDDEENSPINKVSGR